MVQKQPSYSNAQSLGFVPNLYLEIGEVVFFALFALLGINNFRVINKLKGSTSAAPPSYF